MQIPVDMCGTTGYSGRPGPHVVCSCTNTCAPAPPFAWALQLSFQAAKLHRCCSWVLSSVLFFPAFNHSCAGCKIIRNYMGKTFLVMWSLLLPVGRIMPYSTISGASYRLFINVLSIRTFTHFLWEQSCSDCWEVLAGIQFCVLDFI